MTKLPALALAAGEPVSVIGGAAVFALFEPLADRIELTEVLAEIPWRRNHARPAIKRALARTFLRRS
jgi:dihydrofolate reductase